MYGYVYETENLINHKKYIGKKASSVFVPEYHGSGTVLQEAIAKYGENNFETRILEWCDSLEQLNDRERYYIEINDAVHSSCYYNIAKGGDGGNTTLGWTEDRREEFRHKMSSVSKGRIAITREGKLKYVSQKDVHKYIEEGWQTSGLSRSLDSRKKTAEKLQGTRFVTDGVNNLRVDLDDTVRINSLFDQGYRFGFTRTEKQKASQEALAIAREEQQQTMIKDYLNSDPICPVCGKIITELYGSGKYCSKKCASTHFHTQETKDLISLLNKDGVIGNTGRKFSEEHKRKISSSIKNYYTNTEPRMWVNNGSISRRIPESEFAQFSEQGYIKGQLRNPNCVPWNKGLTMNDPRVRKNIENRNNTMLERYGSLVVNKKEESSHS